MMEIFWTMLASQDRKRIREYIAEQNLMAAIEHGGHLENRNPTYPRLSGKQGTSSVAQES